MSDEPPYGPLTGAEILPHTDPLQPPVLLPAPPTRDDTLPYERLSWSRFERLCFQLLVAEGHAPRFFGKAGQAQLGIDLLVEQGDRRTVYQCKHLGHEPSVADIREAVGKFETDWLQRRQLPPPDTLVYCCPQRCDAYRDAAKFVPLCDDFKSRTGVNLLVWERRTFDDKLRNRPDLVAGLFSPAIAQEFCQHPDWRYDLLTPVLTDSEPRHRQVRRFLELRTRDEIYVDPETEDAFSAALANSRVVLVRGVPGSGKTMTTLEMATRRVEPRTGLRYRLYYAQLSDEPKLSEFVRAVQSRCSLPTLFVLDDCFVNFTLAETIAERLAPELEGPSHRNGLILLTRYTPLPDDMPDSDPPFVEELEARDAVLLFETGERQTRQVLEHVRPEFKGLSKERFARIYALTAGDLFLLSAVLGSLETHTDVNQFELFDVLRHARLAYFKKDVVEFPTLMRLAALAQFGIAPLRSAFRGGWEADEWEKAHPLLHEGGRPPRLHFLHSTLAELLFRALAEAHGIRDSAGLAAEVEAAFRDYFAQVRRTPAAAEEAILTALQTMLSTRLKLTRGEAEAQLKTAVVALPEVIEFFQQRWKSVHPAMVGVALHVCRISGHPAAESYARLVEEKLALLFSGNPDAERELGVANLQFRSLKLWSVERHAALEARIGAEKVLSQLRKAGTLLDYLRIVQQASPPFSRPLIDALDESLLSLLLSHTMDRGRSIGTLNLSLWSIGRENPTLHAELEQRIGAARLLALLLANGTLIDLLNILGKSSESFARAVVDLLDEAKMEALVNKTVRVGRSTACLNVALWELGRRDSDLLTDLEERIGAARLLALLLANGTLVELLDILRKCSVPFAQGVVELLDEAKVETLVNKTIAAGRSMGTLGLALRELGQRDEVLLQDLEERIGAARLLTLIQANGTLSDLFKILEYTTTPFARGVVELLDEAKVETLVNKTIAAGRSMGTLNLALRELGQRDEVLLQDLEERIGAARLLTLTQVKGTLVELFRILHYSSASFARALVGQLNETILDELISKTLSGQRSIGSLHFHFAHLRFRKPAEWARLEALLGPERLWTLVTSNASLSTILLLANSTGPAFREVFLTAADDLSEEDWQSVLGRCHLFEVSRFVGQASDELPLNARGKLAAVVMQEAAALVSRAGWYAMNTSLEQLSTTGNTPIVQKLQESIRHRVAKEDLKDVQGLSFHECAHALDLFSRERPELKEPVSQELLTLLPPQNTWLTDDLSPHALTRLLRVAVRCRIPRATSDLIIQSARCFLKRATDTTYPHPVFLVLWNVAAVEYEFAPHRGFGSALSTEEVDYLIEYLSIRAEPKGKSNSEKLSLLTLAGLLCLLAPRGEPKVGAALRGKMPGLEYLHREAQELPFIPAFFALEGMSLLRRRELNFTPNACLQLLVALSAYPETSAALADLESRVRRELRGTGFRFRPSR